MKRGEQSRPERALRGSISGRPLTWRSPRAPSYSLRCKRETQAPNEGEKYRFRGRAAGSRARPPAASQERVLACKLGGKAGRDPRTPRAAHFGVGSPRPADLGWAVCPDVTPLSASRWAPELNIYASLGVEAW